MRPWEALGVSERRYYKLLKRFAPKTGTRYEIDPNVLDQIRSHLFDRDEEIGDARGRDGTASGPRLQLRRCAEVATAPSLQRGTHSAAPN